MVYVVDIVKRGDPTHGGYIDAGIFLKPHAINIYVLWAGRSPKGADLSEEDRDFPVREDLRGTGQF